MSERPILSQEVRQYRHDVCDELASVLQKVTKSPIAILVVEATEDKPEMFVHACLSREAGVNDVAGHESYADVQRYFSGYHKNFSQMEGRTYAWKFAYSPEDYTKKMTELLGRDYTPYQAQEGDDISQLSEQIVKMQDAVGIDVEVFWEDSVYTVVLTAEGQQPFTWSKDMNSIPQPKLDDDEQSFDPLNVDGIAVDDITLDLSDDI